MITCDEANLRYIGLWSYFERMPRILRYAGKLAECVLARYWHYASA